MSKITISCKLNGKNQKLQAYGMDRLLDVIREDAHYTGTKEGCGEGECGACSVIMDGRVVNSCLVPAIQAEGSEITTIEGIEVGGVASDIQKCFLTHGGAQCGICTPGMIIAATDLLKRNPNPTEQQIRDGLSGNLCRCTGYTKIFDSVVAACKKPEART